MFQLLDGRPTVITNDVFVAMENVKKLVDDMAEGLSTTKHNFSLKLNSSVYKLSLLFQFFFQQIFFLSYGAKKMGYQIRWIQKNGVI